MSVLMDFKIPCEVSSASLHPSGDKFVVGSRDFAVYVYSMSGEKLGKSYC